MSDKGKGFPNAGGLRSAATSGAVSGTAPKPVFSQSELAALREAAARKRNRARLVFAVDATASRSAAWDTAQQVTDTLFKALPGELDVALAVHGGGRVHTFTNFVTDPNVLRDTAAGISCESGRTQLVDIMERTAAAPDVKMLLYIGDTFEESFDLAISAADKLKAHGVRMIVLHDDAHDNHKASDTFAALTSHTGGFVLPFDASAATRLREILEATAVLAVGGVKLLEQKRKTLAAATLLLSHLPAGTEPP